MKRARAAGMRAAALCAALLPAAAWSQESITMEDGSRLSVFLLRPDAAAPAPLVVLMGGGSGDLAISRNTALWLGAGFVERGWMVAVPVSPNNRSFRGGENNEKIVELIGRIRERGGVAPGRVLLAGVSNGGLSALEIARRAPRDYFGVVAVPALAGSAADNEALTGFPVYLRIGGADQLGWAARFDETVAAFAGAGVDLDAAILPGQPHMFMMHWPSLGPWLEKIRRPPGLRPRP